MAVYWLALTSVWAALVAWSIQVGDAPIVIAVRVGVTVCFFGFFLMERTKGGVK